MFGWEILLLLMCLIGAAFFAGIETGVVSINPLQLQHFVEEKNDRAARILAKFLNDPDRLLTTTLIGVNLCMVTVSVIATRLGRYLPWHGGAVVTEGVITLLVLIGCEYLPKAWFQSNPIARCRMFAAPLEAAARLFKPLRRIFSWLTKFILLGVPEESAAQRPVVTRDEIELLAAQSAEHGQLTPKQRMMIHRVIELAGKTIPQIMTPREKIVLVKADATAQDFLRIVQETNHTRLPVFDAARNSFVGIVNLFDVLAASPTLYGEKITGFMRPPQFVRDNTPLTELLPRLRRSRQPLALVADEQGEVVGLVTTEDVLRLIIGAE